MRSTVHNTGCKLTASSRTFNSNEGHVTQNCERSMLTGSHSPYLLTYLQTTHVVECYVTRCGELITRLLCCRFSRRYFVAKCVNVAFSHCAVCMSFIDSECDFTSFLGMYVVMNVPVISGCRCTTLAVKLVRRDSSAAVSY